MALRGVLQQLRRRARLHRLADGVAERVFRQVDIRRQHATAGMSAAEARGYLRAWATLAIQREVVQVSQRCRLAPRVQQWLERQAGQRLAERLSLLPPPMPSAPRAPRRAA